MLIVLLVLLQILGLIFLFMGKDYQTFGTIALIAGFISLGILVLI